MRVPEVRMRVVHGAMAQGIKRLVNRGLFEIAGGGDAVYRIDLGGQRAVLIGNDLVLGLGLGDADRLGDALEQIDHRGAAELKGVLADGLFEGDQAVRLVRPSEKDQDFKCRSKSALGQAVQTLQIDEEEFLGEAEILLQKAVTQEAAVGIGQNALGGSESDWLQTVRGQNGLG